MGTCPLCKLRINDWQHHSNKVMTFESNKKVVWVHNSCFTDYILRHGGDKTTSEIATQLCGG